MFIDILPELPPDEGAAKVSFTSEDLSEIDWIMKEIQDGLDELSNFVDVGERPITTLRPRIRTGSTTGNSILSHLP